ncbi:MAG TPA: hypothetical protein VM939_01035 [Gemmatimonadaceae bacterium]|nr:hypothetical protein [Gemmatimonadaceae bacterium]
MRARTSYVGRPIALPGGGAFYDNLTDVRVSSAPASGCMIVVDGKRSQCATREAVRTEATARSSYYRPMALAMSWRF